MQSYMKMHYIQYAQQKAAGCKTVAIYDDFARNEWDEILKTADEIFITPDKHKNITKM